MGDFIVQHFPDFIWSLVVWLVFVVVLLRFGLKPVINALDARDRHIKAQIAEAEDAAKRAKTIQSELDQKMQGAEARISELFQGARRDGEILKEELLGAGRKEVEALRHQALREIEAARHEAIVNLRSEVAEIATSVASRILRHQLDPTLHQDLVRQAIDAYESRTSGSVRS